MFATTWETQHTRPEICDRIHFSNWTGLYGFPLQAFHLETSSSEKCSSIRRLHGELWILYIGAAENTVTRSKTRLFMDVKWWSMGVDEAMLNRCDRAVLGLSNFFSAIAFLQSIRKINRAWSFIRLASDDICIENTFCEIIHDCNYNTVNVQGYPTECALEIWNEPFSN